VYQLIATYSSCSYGKMKFCSISKCIILIVVVTGKKRGLYQTFTLGESHMCLISWCDISKFHIRHLCLLISPPVWKVASSEKTVFLDLFIFWKSVINSQNVEFGHFKIFEGGVICIHVTVNICIELGIYI
jgi:hypothetical protein